MSTEEYTYIEDTDHSYKWSNSGHLLLRMWLTEEFLCVCAGEWLIIGYVLQKPTVEICRAMNSAYFLGLAEGQRQGRVASKKEFRDFLGIKDN